MHYKLKNAWLKALRSGDYKQGHGQFCKSRTETSEDVDVATDGSVTKVTTTTEAKTYCCLGVLTHVILTNDEFEGIRDQLRITGKNNRSSWAHDGAFTNPDLRKLGLHGAGQTGDAVNDLQQTLIRLNDTHGERVCRRGGDGTFREIADVIELMVPTTHDDDLLVDIYPKVSVTEPSDF